MITTLIHGDEDKAFCSCNEIATKEVIYYRVYDGFLKRFKEMICEDCLNDEGYFRGKTIVSIEAVEPVSNRIFSNKEVFDKFSELFNN
jgi:hypothetical protein